jgi:hypothetical protein
MKTPIAAIDRLFQFGAVAEISLHALVIGIGQTACVAAGPQQRLDPMSTGY